jgi:hypothetical protein
MRALLFTLLLSLSLLILFSFVFFSVLDTFNAKLPENPLNRREGRRRSARERARDGPDPSTPPLSLTPFTSTRRVSLILSPSFDSFSSLRFRSLFYLKCFLLRHPSLVAPASVVHLGRNLEREGERESEGEVGLVGGGWWGDVVRWGTGVIPDGAIGANVTYLVVGSSADADDVVQLVRRATAEKEGVRVGAVILGDEKERAVRPAGADFLIKNYQSANASLPFTWLQCAGVTSACTNVPFTFDLTFDCPDKCEQRVMKKSSEREIEWNFVGSLRRNRAEIVANLSTQVVDPTKQVVKVTGNFNKGSRSDYEAILSNSVYTVTPCGNNAETIRFWEALDRGSLPLIEDCRTRRGHVRRFQRALARAHFPLPFFRDFSNLSAILGEKGGKIDEKQGKVVGWVREWERGVKREVVSAVLGWTD